MPKKRLVASTNVRLEWQRRVAAEYRSSAVTQQLTIWLTQLGASPDLVYAGLRIARDELDHAALSHRVLERAGGSVGEGLTMDREALSIPRRYPDSLERDITLVALEAFCLGETVAVPLFKALREGCTVPEARRVLDRILRDEVRHRDFGWTLLGWLFEAPFGEEMRAFARQTLPGAFARLRSVYCSGHVETIDSDDLLWGLMPSARYATILERAVPRDFKPRFGRVGIDLDAVLA